MISMFPECLCHTLHIATFFSPCCNRAALDHGNHQKPISRLGQRGFSDLQDQLCLFGRPKLGYTNQSKSLHFFPQMLRHIPSSKSCTSFFDPRKKYNLETPLPWVPSGWCANLNYTKSSFSRPKLPATLPRTGDRKTWFFLSFPFKNPHNHSKFSTSRFKLPGVFPNFWE